MQAEVAAAPAGPTGWTCPLLVDWAAMSLGMLNIGTCWTTMLPASSAAHGVAAACAISVALLLFCAAMQLALSVLESCGAAAVKKLARARNRPRCGLCSYILFQVSLNGSGATLMATIGLTGWAAAAAERQGWSSAWLTWCIRVLWGAATAAHVANQAVYVIAVVDTARQRAARNAAACAVSTGAEGDGAALVEAASTGGVLIQLLRDDASGDWFPPTVGVGAASIAAAQLHFGSAWIATVFAVNSAVWTALLVPMVFASLVRSRRLWRVRSSAVMAAPTFLCFVAWLAAGAGASPGAEIDAADVAFIAFFCAALLCSTITLTAVPTLFLGHSSSSLSSLTFPLEITTIGIVRFTRSMEASGALARGSDGAAALWGLAWAWLGVTTLVVVGVVGRFLWALGLAAAAQCAPPRVRQRLRRGNDARGAAHSTAATVPGAQTRAGDVSGAAGMEEAVVEEEGGGGGEATRILFNVFKCSPWTQPTAVSA